VTDAQQLRGPALVLGLLIVIGTAGYVVIEGWPILDALYMTVTTLATVAASLRTGRARRLEVALALLLAPAIAAVDWTVTYHSGRPHDWSLRVIPLLPRPLIGLVLTLHGVALGWLFMRAIGAPSPIQLKTSELVLAAVQISRPLLRHG